MVFHDGMTIEPPKRNLDVRYKRQTTPRIAVVGPRNPAESIYDDDREFMIRVRLGTENGPETWVYDPYLNAPKVRDARIIIEEYAPALYKVVSVSLASPPAILALSGNTPAARSLDSTRPTIIDWGQLKQGRLHPTSPPSMKLVIESYTFYEAGTPYTVARQETSTITAPATGYARWDFVSVDRTTLAVQITTGTAFVKTNPETGVKPTPPSDCVPHGYVLVHDTATVLGESAITHVPPYFWYGAEDLDGDYLRIDGTNDLQGLTFDSEVQVTWQSGTKSITVTDDQTLYEIIGLTTSGHELDTITGGAIGQIIVVRATNSGGYGLTITNNGNIVSSGWNAGYLLGHRYATAFIRLAADGAAPYSWHQIPFSLDTYNIQYPVSTATDWDHAGFNFILDTSLDELASRVRVLESIPDVAHGRLTLRSSDPYSSTNTSNVVNIFYLNYEGKHVRLYDTTNSRWYYLDFTLASIKLTDTHNGDTVSGSAVVTNTNTDQWIAGMEVTGTGIPASTTILSIDSATQFTMSANATGTATVSITAKIPADSCVDIFCFDDSGTLKLEFGSLWTSTTARATALATQDRIYVKSGDASRLWLGTCLTTGTAGQTSDALDHRGLWNYYKRRPKKMLKGESSAHTYGTASWDYWDSDSSNKLDFVVGLAEWAQIFTLFGDVEPTTGLARLGWGHNGISTSLTYWSHAVNGEKMEMHALGVITPTLGKNTVYAAEYAAANADYGYYQITGDHWC